MQNTTSIQTKIIKNIQCGIYSSEDMDLLVDDMYVNKKISITKNKDHTLYDLKMGTTNSKQRCHKCYLNKNKDPGHYGIIDLQRIPVYNPIFIKVLKDVLIVTCFKCGHLMIPLKMQKYIKLFPRIKRLKMCKSVIDKKNGKLCNTCITNNKFFDNSKIIYSEKNSIMIFISDSNNIKKDYPPEFSFERLSKINNDELETMGFNSKTSHPKNMILQKILVVPATIRPNLYILENLNTTSEDNLFKFYKTILDLKLGIEILLDKPIETNIIKFNKFIAKLEVEKEKLYMAIASLITTKSDNIFNLKSGNNKILASIKTQLTKKTGYFRNNIMGKRKNHSGRSPINGDSTILANEIGVPELLCKKLAIGIIVSRYNIKDLKNRVLNGTNIFPGANCLIKKNGNKHCFLWPESLNQPIQILKDKKLYKSYLIAMNIINNIEYGDKIYRHQKDGDIVIMNRQPALHKLSIMAHKVRVIGGDVYTLRLNNNTTGPYNADFDGDEMNISSIHSLASIIECENILAVENHILDSVGSRATVVPIHDNILAGYIITKYPNNIIEKHEFMNIICSTEYYNVKYVRSLYNKPNLEYIDLLNAIFPSNFNFKMKQFSIIQGKIINGLLTNSIMKNLIKAIIDQYGNKTALYLESAHQKITDKFLMYYGVTLSINDFYIPKKLRLQLHKNFEKLQKDNIQLLSDFNNEKIIIPITQTPEEAYEQLVTNIINECFKKNGALVINYLENESDNNLVNQYKSGARGKIDNMYQIFNSVGSQILEGKRIQPRFGYRTSPHFTKYDNSLLSRGFVFSSFIEGLNPIEYYNHAKSGRSGMSDTALKTSKTGYNSRELIKISESNVCSYDNFIRISNGLIISYGFGHNHFNTIKLFTIKLKIKTLSDEEFDELYV